MNKACSTDEGCQIILFGLSGQYNKQAVPSLGGRIS